MRAQRTLNKLVMTRKYKQKEAKEQEVQVVIEIN
jgi:hypothetical protein